MSVEEIKNELASLSQVEQKEVTDFLLHLRLVQDPAYQELVSERMSDKDASHWLKPEEFERQLDRR